ncbi:MAG TPA: MFS transporter [Micromonosporaceae bacterium]
MTDIATPTAANERTEPPNLWRNRSFNLLWSSQLLSDLGTNMSSLAFPLLVLALTGSAVMAGIVGTGAAVVRLALRLPSGVIADRVDRKRAMILCDAVRLVAFLALGLLVLSGNATMPLILATAMIEAVGSAIFGTIQMASLRNVVPIAQIPAAVARDEARSASASLFGPPLGGVLFSIARGLPFLGDALSYLCSMIGISLIRTPMQEKRTEPAASVGSDIREGIRFAVSNPFVRSVMMMAPLINLGFNGMLFAVIIVLKGEGVAPGLIGTVDTIVAIGGLAGAFAAGPLQRVIPLRTLVLSISWLGALLMASAALLTDSVAVAVPIAVAIFFSPACNAAMFGYQAAITPDRLQGRVISVLMFTAMSLSAVAPLLAGVFYDWLGGPGTVLAFAAIIAVAATMATFSKAIRTMREPADIMADAHAADRRPEAAGEILVTAVMGAETAEP